MLKHFSSQFETIFKTKQKSYSDFFTCTVINQLRDFKALGFRGSQFEYIFEFECVILQYQLNNDVYIAC